MRRAKVRRAESGKVKSLLSVSYTLVHFSALLRIPREPRIPPFAELLPLPPPISMAPVVMEALTPKVCHENKKRTYSRACELLEPTATDHRLSTTI